MNKPIYRMKVDWAESFFVTDYLKEKYGESWNKVRGKKLTQRYNEAIQKYNEKKQERRKRYFE